MDSIKKFGIFTSSVDPEKLSTAVEAFLKVAAGIMAAWGILSAEDSITLLQAVPQLITTILAIVPLAFSAWHFGEMIFGVFRKVLVALIALSRKI